MSRRPPICASFKCNTNWGRWASASSWTCCVLELENDDRLLTCLLVHASSSRHDDRLEQIVLILNFRATDSNGVLYYAITCPIWASNGKRALQEMPQVVGYFANRMAERSAYAAAYH
jgi:hypothetical protein